MATRKDAIELARSLVTDSASKSIRAWKEGENRPLNRPSKPAQNKNLVIYHGNCADGFSAAWCFWDARDKFPDGLEFHKGVYNEPPPDVTGKVVYLVDFSYKKEIVTEMLEGAESITLIDHHKTAIEDLQPLFIKDSWAGRPNQLLHYCDMERSGAMLAWDYLHNRIAERGGIMHKSHVEYIAPPLLLEYVQDRDLWKFKLEASREVSASIFSYEYSFETWDKLMAGKASEVMQMAAGGIAIERKHHKDITELLAICMAYKWIGGWQVPCVNMPYTMASDAAQQLAAEHLDGTLFAATYYDTATHRVFSLRSTPEGMDVSKIAAEYGGGGHKHAAGFRISLTNIYEGIWHGQ
jgi:oligoribonuclease NrnB/cAMP/cGMP phosphodiesterase (DHH superfamily)